MDKRFAIAALCIAAVALAAAAQTSELTRLSDPVEGRLNMTQTTLEDQTDVSVTVYNDDRAVVRDQRKIKLLPGELALRFMDVAQNILPQTVSLRSLSDPGALRILEQNYEFDLISPEKLMEKYVGKEVALINKSSDFSFYEQPATLLSINNGPVYEVEGKIYLGHPGVVVLPEMPNELIAKPTLVWLLDNQGADHEVEVAYMTRGMSWTADYVLTLNKAENAMDIEGWVTLNNQSGAAYTQAQLKLVAGDVNLVREQAPMMQKRMAMDTLAAGAPPMMEQEAFAEYHLYTLARRTTLLQNQSKQVSLLKGTNVAIEKRYEFRGDLNFYSMPIATQKDQNADVFLVFKNKEENGMGMPLPAGVMRVYQEDRSGMLQFSGEDRIQHTPKNEDVRLTLGKAFDIVGDRTQTEHKSLANNAFETAFKISLRNRKESAVTVDVVEPMPGDWRILEQSHEHQKKDVRTAVFPLSLPADSEVELTYKVRVSY